MPNLRLRSTFLLAAILGGCQQAPAPSADIDSAPASVAPGAPAPSGTAAGSRTQELRGQVQQLKSGIDQHLAQLSQIRQERQALASQYYTQVGEISTKLQAGTTPSNPVLTQKWTEARRSLDKLEDNLSHVTALSNDMAVDGQTGVYLDDSTRAALLMPGALDEDHSQLRSLQAEVAGAQAEIGGELIDVTTEINRQNAALEIERNNIATLAESVRVGELLGHSLANNQLRYVSLQASPAAPIGAPATAPVAHGHGKAAGPHHQYALHRHKGAAMAHAAPAPGAPPSVQAGPVLASSAAPSDAPMPLTPSSQHVKPAAKPVHPVTKASAVDKRAPLMVIRFDRFTERYEEALYRAISQTLDAQPNANFQIRGVTPEASMPAGTAERLAAVRRHVEDVQRSLLAFGLTPTRISTSAEANVAAPVEEIRIYKQ